MKKIIIEQSDNKFLKASFYCMLVCFALEIAALVLTVIGRSEE